MMIPLKEEYVENFTKKCRWSIQFGNEYPNDESAAQLLNISYEKFKRIIKKHGARKRNSLEYWFQTQEQTQSAIIELEPYYILSKLVGE